MADIGVIDTGFRSAVRKLDRAGRMLHVHDRLDPYLEVAAFVKHHDGDRALFFQRVGDHAMPVCANLLACHANILTVFGLDVQGVRAAVERGIHRPLPPRLVDGGPCQDVVVRDGIDLGTMFPVLHHMPGDAGRFFTASVVIARDPETATPPFTASSSWAGTRRPSSWTWAGTCDCSTGRPSGRRRPSPSPW